MEASDIKKMKDLEESSYETDVCQSQFGMQGIQRRYRKKALKPARKRELVSYLTAQFEMSIRQACGTLSLSRIVYFYQPDTGEMIR